MGQSQANEWIHRLSEVPGITLEELDHLPERDPQGLEKTLTKDGETEFVTDGTEREICRPADNEKQKKYQSGKKKRHTVKNNLIVSVGGRKAGYPGGTCEGKKHDKNIRDEENPVFPKGIILSEDTGFRGYGPEGADTGQPKKKPRGGELSVGEKVGNSVISGVRIVVEHIISGVKRCRIAEEKFRNKKKNYDDIVIEIACGLHNPEPNVVRLRIEKALLISDNVYCIVRRNSVRQFQKGLKPFISCVTEFFHSFITVCSADNSTDAYGYNINQFMASV